MLCSFFSQLARPLAVINHRLPPVSSLLSTDLQGDVAHHTCGIFPFNQNRPLLADEIRKHELNPMSSHWVFSASTQLELLICMLSFGDGYTSHFIQVISRTENLNYTSSFREQWIWGDGQKKGPYWYIWLCYISPLSCHGPSRPQFSLDKWSFWLHL